MKANSNKTSNPGFIETLILDIRAFMRKDPSCNSVLDVLFCHSGFHAIFSYRICHFIWNLNLGILSPVTKFIAKLMTQSTKIVTGIEIHPGAQIGKSFFIDHGFGVVIGETTIIANGVSVYQGVTLGGVSFNKGEKRHPTIGSNTIVGAGAKVLGNINIGSYVQVGANAVVVKDVPDKSSVVGIPGRIVKMNGKALSAIENLEHNKVPDPVASALNLLNEKISKLDRMQKEIMEITGCKEKVKAMEASERPETDAEKEVHEQESKESECIFGDAI